MSTSLEKPRADTKIWNEKLVFGAENFDGFEAQRNGFDFDFDFDLQQRTEIPLEKFNRKVNDVNCSFLQNAICFAARLARVFKLSVSITLFSLSALINLLPSTDPPFATWVEFAKILFNLKFETAPYFWFPDKSDQNSEKLK